jgi:hypothetical protein
MPRDEQGVLDGLAAEFEQANAVTSASVGMTPMQSNTDIIQEDLAGDLANLESFPEGQHQAQSEQ